MKTSSRIETKNKTAQTGHEDWTIEHAVHERYANGAGTREEALCCPVEYDPRYLKVLPSEILEKDYGCGDPSRYLREGDMVLDLGSGAGKICYIASQVIGPKGKVIGVDFNPAMLDLARRYLKSVGEKIGWHNVEFRRGMIQDLATDLDRLEKWIESRPIRSLDAFLEFEQTRKKLRKMEPLVASESVDVVVSNCVLNLVRPEDKKQLFSEIYRVLKTGGRIAISDIVSDEEVPEAMQKDPRLWSGCISGAFQEKAFLKAFEEAGFYGMTLDKRDEKPWKTVKGIEFRSVTVTGYKGKEGPCWERNQAVIYKGPWKQVVDDDRHVLKRGIPTAVCDKTYQIYSKAPYRDYIYPIPPRRQIPLPKAKPFNCQGSVERDPRQTKGKKYRKTTETSSCLDGGCC